MKKHQQFANAGDYFACPHCKEVLTLEGASLRCPNRHTFDLARQGYVNLLGASKISINYDKDSFAQRQAFLEAGYYDHIYEALEERLVANKLTSLLDIGCGEGFYSRCLARQNHWELLAFDLSKDSILMAARADATKSVKWFVGDLTKLPLQDGVIDGVLDIFSPAHYQEFDRVLKDDGLIFKFVPGRNHLKELRQLAKDQLRQADYDNQTILARFKDLVAVEEEVLVSKTQPISPEDAKILADMTPLLFQVDKDSLDLTGLTEITIEAQLLVGRKK